MSSLDEAVEVYHEAIREFVKGKPEPIKAFSSEDDVVLCNPFRPFARGPTEVSETIREAASHFSDGECEFERVATFATPELAYILEIERFQAVLDGEQGSGALRVTTIFRWKDGDWRVLHRHADPITTPRATQSIVQE